MNINVTLWKYLLRSIRIMAHKLSKKKKPYKKWVLFKPLMGNNQSMERDEITTNILDKYHNQVRNSCHSCWKKKCHIISVIKCNHFFLNYMAIVEIKAPSTQLQSTDYIYKHNPNIELVPLFVLVTITRTTPLSGGTGVSLCEPWWCRAGCRLLSPPRHWWSPPGRRCTPPHSVKHKDKQCKS